MRMMEESKVEMVHGPKYEGKESGCRHWPECDFVSRAGLRLRQAVGTQLMRGGALLALELGSRGWGCLKESGSITGGLKWLQRCLKLCITDDSSDAKNAGIMVNASQRMVS